jgi:5-methylcytosine-specific restriction endonuclease McrA
MATALLLNASYEPLRVIPITRALNLVLANKAVVELETDHEIRSQTMVFRVPSVVRLTRMVRVPYRARIPLTRQNLIARDDGLCGYCGTRVGRDGTIDHIIPRSKPEAGGVHRWENVVLACARCNNRKGNQTLAELGWRLRTTPYAPKGTAWLIIGLHRVDEAWEPYLATS